MTSCCMVPLLCTPTQPAIHWIHCKKTRNAMPRMFGIKMGGCTVERCDTQSSQRDSEEVNSVEVLCPCFQLRQTRLSHEHNTSLLSKRRFSKVWIFHDDAWLDSRGWFCLYLPDCHFCLQLYRISAIAKSVKSQNETRHKRREGIDFGCQRLKKKLF